MGFVPARVVLDTNRSKPTVFHIPYPLGLDSLPNHQLDEEARVKAAKTELVELDRLRCYLIKNMTLSYPLSFDDW